MESLKVHGLIKLTYNNVIMLIMLKNYNSYYIYYFICNITINKKLIIMLNDYSSISLILYYS